MFISMIKYLNYKWQLKVANAKLLLDQANNRISEEKIKKEHKEHLMMRRAGLDKIKLKAEEILAETQTEASKKKAVTVLEFDSAEWNTASSDFTRNVTRKKAIAFQIAEGYRYMTTIYEWDVGTESTKTMRSKCNAAFSDNPIEIFNANDEIIKIILDEVKEVVPLLLVHPNEKIRAIAEKVYQTNKNDES